MPVDKVVSMNPTEKTVLKIEDQKQLRMQVQQELPCK